MSGFRRRLMMQKPGGDPFVAVVNAINNLSGEKSFLLKFDNTPLVYVLTMPTWSSTYHTLHIFDLNGNELASVYQNSSRHFGAVIDNYICIYQGTSNSSVPIDIFQFDGTSTITKIRTRNTDNWVGSAMQYAYKDGSNNIHFCSYANSGRNAVWDYNVQTGSYVRTESGKDAWVTWYNYDGTYFRGLLWSSTSNQQRVVSYVKSTSTTNSWGSSYSPSLANNYCAYFLPLFFFDNSYDKLQYEVFAGASVSNVEYFTNVVGIDQPDPSSLSFGNISIPYRNINNPYSLLARSGLSYVDNGHLCIYTPNISTGVVEKITF